MIFRSNSILSRITWWHIVAVSLAAVGIPFAAYYLLNSIATDFENQELRQHADIIAEYIEPQGDGSLNLNLPADLAALYEGGVGGFSLSVVDGSGRVLYSTFPDNAPIWNFDSRSTAPTFLQDSNVGMAYYGANIPERVGDQTVWIQLAQYIDHPDVIVDNIIADFLRRIVWFVLPIMVLLFVVDFAIVRRALRPVKAASKLAQSIGPSRIDQRLPTEGMPSEILPLVGAINQALGRLERGFRLQREFTADTAHELRTPLAILRMKIDKVSDQPLANSLCRDVDAMTRVVGQLLELAELDNAITDLSEIVDLHQVCTEVLALVAPLALAQRKRLALTGAEGAVWVTGNGTLLFQAIRNIVDNAIKHTEPGTAVEVSVQPNGTVYVMDKGPGVPDEDHELIFRRFWRRDRDKQSGGSGLGLSIVSRIVEAHGGSVKVENRPGGGAIFCLSLILAPDLQRPSNSHAKRGGEQGIASRHSEAVSA